MNNNESFATRLKQACDDSAAIPEHGKGRQVTIANHMNVSQEAVRKWFDDKAKSKPRPEKMRRLAEFLGVDEAWLALGIRQDMKPAEKKMAGRQAEGAALVLAGFIQMGGGNCAFPTDDDPRKDYVDFYAIIRGKKVDVHVSTARRIDDDTFEIIVPRQYQDVRCIGYLSAVATGVLFNLIDLPKDLITKHKVTKGGDYSLTISRSEGRYMTGEDEWPKLKAGGDLI